MVYIPLHEYTVCIWIKMDILIYPNLYRELWDNIDLILFFSPYRKPLYQMFILFAKLKMSKYFKPCNKLSYLPCSRSINIFIWIRVFNHFMHLQLLSENIWLGGFCHINHLFSGGCRRRRILHQRKREERGKTDKERDGGEKNHRSFSLTPSLSRVQQTPTGN